MRVSNQPFDINIVGCQNDFLLPGSTWQLRKRPFNGKQSILVRSPERQEHGGGTAGGVVGGSSPAGGLGSKPGPGKGGVPPRTRTAWWSCSPECVPTRLSAFNQAPALSCLRSQKRAIQAFKDGGVRVDLVNVCVLGCCPGAVSHQRVPGSAPFEQTPTVFDACGPGALRTPALATAPWDWRSESPNLPAQLLEHLVTLGVPSTSRGCCEGPVRWQSPGCDVNLDALRVGVNDTG